MSLQCWTGSKIAVLDSGIDVNHPAFRDAALQAPAGYPICRRAADGSAGDCAWTNNKIIVARSYVDSLAAGDGTPDDSRPDDLSPRDRVGHGTAVAMIAAGVSATGPAATVSGVAPKAYLGNYKIFGSPGVNDTTFSDVVVQALEDALADGMDVATLSLGLPALWSPKDVGATCNYTGTTPCDPWAAAVEQAVGLGLTVVASAGDDGDVSLYLPNLNSINTPGTAPSVITVGATTNAHTFYSTIRLQGTGVPSVLDPIATTFTDGPRPGGPITAPVVDAATLGADGACRPLGNGTLAGAFALIRRGGTNDCQDEVKILNAQTSGAVGVIFYRAQNNTIYAITGLGGTGIPSVLIGLDAGTALKSYLQANPAVKATIDPALREDTNVTADEIAYFSSEGPAIGDLLIKPELVAPGTGLYVATQTYDPNGDMWDPNGYTAIQGTSFSAAMVAGAVAIANQRFPAASPAQLKSMVVNTASPDNIFDYDLNNNRIPARVTGMGAGKLNLGNVARTTVTAEPATISFGAVNSLPSNGVTKGLVLSNLGTSPANLHVAVEPSIHV